MIIQENILLKNFTTFRTGGPARYFVVVKNIEDLQQAIIFAKKENLPIFVLGGGSNILVSDEGFPGLVIKMEINGIRYQEKNDNEIEVTAGAGVVWDAFVQEVVSKGLGGIENLSYIPGSVGAAPVQNIGAYGSEIKDTLIRVQTVDSETGEIKEFVRTQCEFMYRDSFFKKPEGKKYIITEVTVLLKKDNPLNVSYKDITEYISSHNISDLNVQKIRDIVIAIRKNKLPEVSEYGTAGSFFKNPIISKEKFVELQKTYPTLPSYPTAYPDLVKVPAAWILDNLCGFKGFRDKDVGVYKNQALVLVNFGEAKADDVKNLAQKMIECVKEKTEIELEREVLYV